MTDLLRRFAAYYRPHRGLFALDFSSFVAAGLLELTFPIAVTLFIYRLLPINQFGKIALASVGLFLIYLVNAGLQVIITHSGHMLGLKIETEMQRKAADHLQKLSFEFFDNQKTGHMLVGVFYRPIDKINSIIETYPKGIADFQRYTTFVDTRPVIADLTLTATCADHLVVLDRGTVTAEGPPLRLLSVRPSVDARIERCSRGRPHILVDGPAIPSEVRHAG